MILPKGLEAEFWQDFKQFEQERTMSYITTGERIGYERGQQEVVIKQLQRRVGELPEEVKTDIQALSPEQLEAVGEALRILTIYFTGCEQI